MIVGAAQVVVNVADLEPARAELLAEPGTKETFAALDLANNPVKAPFQGAPRERMAMVHLTPAEGLAVELTRYEGAPPAGTAAYKLRREGEGPPVVVAPGGDREASERFWTEGLRFTSDEAGRLAAPAMHPAWRLGLELGSEPAAGTTTVDAEGCVLVTLLTTSIDRELERLQGTGLLLRSTASWTEQVADRQTRVAFVEGPSGELVELLQAPRPGEG